MEMYDILIILIAALLNMAIGAVWYSSFLFGDRWFFLSGYNKNDATQMDLMKKGAMTSYIVSGLNSFIIAFVLWFILQKVVVTSFSEAVFTALILWSGFVVTTSLTNTLFSRRTKELWAIDTGYHCAGMVVMTIFLFLM